MSMRLRMSHSIHCLDLCMLFFYHLFLFLMIFLTFVFSLLSGILHLNKSHIGFTEQENKAISREVLETFYNQDRKEEDIQRAQDAAFLWSSWVQVSHN